MGTSRRRVGLFGGSFNPPHVCHTLATCWALQTGNLDEVWWLPTYQHAFGKELVSFETRVQMCELALRDLKGVKICTIERELAGESRTIDTVEALQARHPQDDYTLIVGADILAERHKWKNWEGLMELVTLKVIGRAGYEEAYQQWQEEQVARRAQAGADDASARHRALPFTLPVVSSTRIRQMLKIARQEARAEFDGWLIDAVIDFIEEQGLYAE